MNNIPNWLAITFVIIGLVFTGLTLWQKYNTDKRSEWWKRTSWSLDNFFDENVDKQKLGTKLLLHQLSADTALIPSEKNAMEKVFLDWITSYYANHEVKLKEMQDEKITLIERTHHDR